MVADPALGTVGKGEVAVIWEPILFSRPYRLLEPRMALTPSELEVRSSGQSSEALMPDFCELGRPFEVQGPSHAYFGTKSLMEHTQQCLQRETHRSTQSLACICTLRLSLGSMHGCSQEERSQEGRMN